MRPGACTIHSQLLPKDCIAQMHLSCCCTSVSRRQQDLYQFNQLALPEIPFNSCLDDNVSFCQPSLAKVSRFLFGVPGHPATQKSCCTVPTEPSNEGRVQPSLQVLMFSRCMSMFWLFWGVIRSLPSDDRLLQNIAWVSFQRRPWQVRNISSPFYMYKLSELCFEMWSKCRPFCHFWD